MFFSCSYQHIHRGIWFAIDFSLSCHSIKCIINLKTYLLIIAGIIFMVLFDDTDEEGVIANVKLW